MFCYFEFAGSQTDKLLTDKPSPQLSPHRLPSSWWLMCPMMYCKHHIKHVYYSSLLAGLLGPGLEKCPSGCSAGTSDHIGLRTLTLLHLLTATVSMHSCIKNKFKADHRTNRAWPLARPRGRCALVMFFYNISLCSSDC